MQACTEHLMYQLTNDHSRIGYVLGAIKKRDAPILKPWKIFGNTPNPLESETTLSLLSLISYQGYSI